MVDWARFELATSGLQSQRSNQLIYQPTNPAVDWSLLYTFPIGSRQFPTQCWNIQNHTAVLSMRLATGWIRTQTSTSDDEFRTWTDSLKNTRAYASYIHAGAREGGVLRDMLKYNVAC